MRILAIFFLTLLLGKGCGKEQQKDMDDAVIEYTATTRGYYQKIRIQDQEFFVSKDRDGKAKPIEVSLSKESKEQLLAFFKEIDLEELPTLKAPSEKRFYDGAAIATFSITYKGKTYTTENFDHGNPPAEIEKLVEKINALAPKE